MKSTVPSQYSNVLTPSPIRCDMASATESLSVSAAMRTSIFDLYHWICFLVILWLTKSFLVRQASNRSKKIHDIVWFFDLSCMYFSLAIQFLANFSIWQASKKMWILLESTGFKMDGFIFTRSNDAPKILQAETFAWRPSKVILAILTPNDVTSVIIWFMSEAFSAAFNAIGQSNRQGKIGVYCR